MSHELEGPRVATSLRLEGGALGRSLPAPAQEAGGGRAVGEGHHLLPSILPGGQRVSVLSLTGQVSFEEI